MGLFKFYCPHCGEVLEAKDEWRGRQTQCPQCQTKITIPLVVKVDYDAIADQSNKKKIILCLSLLGVAALIWGMIAIFNYQAEKKRSAKIALAEKLYAAEKKLQEERRIIEEKRRIEENKLREEKRLAEEKRLREEKRSAEASIKAELERARQCEDLQDAVAILDKVIFTYAKHNDLLYDVHQQRKIFKDGIEIRQEIWQAKNSTLYQDKIYLLERVIRRYSSSPYVEEAKKLLLEYKEGKIRADEQMAKKRAEEQRRADQRRIAEQQRQIAAQQRQIANQQRQIANPQRQIVGARRRMTGQEDFRNEEPCRWCDGSGKRSSISSIYDCTFCLGHGIAMTRVERERHRDHCRTFKSTRFGCRFSRTYYHSDNRRGYRR